MMKVLSVICGTLFFSGVLISHGHTSPLASLKEKVNDVTENVSTTLSGKAMATASEVMLRVASEFALVKPQLESLGYHLSIVDFQMLPPSVHLCIISVGSNEVAEDFEYEGGNISKMLLQSAFSAKKAQNLIGLKYVVVNMSVGSESNIRVSYYSEGDFSDVDEEIIGKESINNACSSSVKKRSI